MPGINSTWPASAGRSTAKHEDCARLGPRDNVFVFWKRQAPDGAQILMATSCGIAYARATARAGWAPAISLGRQRRPNRPLGLSLLLLPIFPVAKPLLKASV